MKKIFIITLIALILSACSSGSQDVVNQSENVDERFERDSYIHPSIIIDTETGCKYLFMKSSNAGGLSPLYNEKGEMDCEKEENAEIITK